MERRWRKCAASREFDAWAPVAGVGRQLSQCRLGGVRQSLSEIHPLARRTDLQQFDHAKELPSLSPRQRADLAALLELTRHEVARSVVLDGLASAAGFASAIVFFVEAIQGRSAWCMVGSVLMLPVCFRLLDGYGLQRDTYYGIVRRQRELIPGLPDVSRFDG